MSTLNEVAPEPVSGSMPGIPTSLPNSGSTHPYLTKSMNILRKVQQYSVIPFTGFAVIHLSGVLISPALFGTRISEDLISMGRELYQVPIIEIGLLASTVAHVVSGMGLNLLRRYYNYVKYGKSKVKKNVNKDKLESSLKINGNPEDVEVKDINEGLGGISSIVGAGSRQSITSRLFGLSPLAFSGYVFLGCILGHIYYERISPLLVDGDSSNIDLTYIAYALQNTFAKTFTALNVLVATGCYHMLVGWNRYLRRFSLKQRRRTYQTLLVLSGLCVVSLLRVRGLDVYTAAARRFAKYV